jgi:hypothetical protein
MAKASLPLGDELCSMPTLRSLEMTYWAVLSLLLIRIWLERLQIQTSRAPASNCSKGYRFQGL